MTESEWLVSTDPQAMLAWLMGDYSPVARDLGSARVSDRKLRLLACAFLRTVWRQLDVTSQRAADVAERFADGQADEAERTQFHDTDRRENYPARAACFGNPTEAAHWTLQRLMVNQHHQPHSLVVDAKALADCLRDIVGNPFRPVVLPPGELTKCRTCNGEGELTTSHRFDCYNCDGQGTRHKPCSWLTPLVVSLAQGAYDNRLPSGQLDPEILAVLSDALEDAGCPTHETATERVRVCTAFMYSHQEMGVECNCDSWRDVKVERPHPILAHLRSPGPHWRGCWAVDLLLEKE